MKSLEQPVEQPSLTSEAITSRSLSIVLPAYNEEAVITNSVRSCLQTAERLGLSVQVLVVDDGSRDRTGAIVDALAAADPRVVALHHASNRGYGATMVSGFNAAQGELLFFMDSDGQFDVADIAKLLKYAEQQPGQVVLGYREHRRDPLPRLFFSWGWKQIVRIVLGLHGIRDIDCAFKLFPTQLVQACDINAQGPTLNAELLVKLQRMHIPMVQVPVGHFPRMHGKATGVSLRIIVRAFQELVHLRLRLRAWPPTEPLTMSTRENGRVNVFPQ